MILRKDFNFIMNAVLKSDYFCVRQKGIDLMENFKDNLQGNLFDLFKNCLDNPKYSIRQNYIFFLKVVSVTFKKDTLNYSKYMNYFWLPV